jgi:hypothetical protein
MREELGKLRCGMQTYEEIIITAQPQICLCAGR